MAGNFEVYNYIKCSVNCFWVSTCNLSFYGHSSKISDPDSLWIISECFRVSTSSS